MIDIPTEPTEPALSGGHSALLDRSDHYRAGLMTVTMLRRVRELRSSGTPAETILWEFLRSRRLNELKFRRQHQFGSYILDFFCPATRVAVELDGQVHDSTDRREHDAIRDRFLIDQGVKVVRFRNEQVYDDIAGVLRTIVSSCLELTPTT